MTRRPDPPTDRKHSGVATTVARGAGSPREDARSSERSTACPKRRRWVFKEGRFRWIPDENTL